MADLKRYIKAFYYSFFNLIIGFIVSYFLKIAFPDWTENDRFVFFFFVLAPPIIYVYFIIGKIVFGVKSPVEAMANRIMKCNLRIEHGLNYCVKCKDSYACASGEGKNAG